MCNLRYLVRPMLVCEVGNGRSASFWHDNWTSLGPLIDITGPRGPAVTGLPENEVYAGAISNGAWWISRSRSRNRFISLLRECLPEVAPILSSEVNDIYLWKPGNNAASSSFSTASTWEALRTQGETVFFLNS